jgi:hypothetical protein
VNPLEGRNALDLAQSRDASRNPEQRDAVIALLQEKLKN